jgi:hypothetical protein
MPDGIHVRIQEKGRPISEIIKVSQNKIPSNVKMSGIKKMILAHLQMYINSQRSRPIEEHPKQEGKVERLTQRNNLYNTIEAGTTLKEIKTEDGHYKYELGIGEKRDLQLHAPYWKVINYGGYVPPPTIGYFGNGKGPLAGGGGERFTATGGWKGTNPYTRGGNSFLMVPKKPITGMHYIEEMAKVMEIELALIRAEFNQR